MNKITDKRNYNEMILSRPGLQVVKFYADWSGPCQMMLPIYNELPGMYNSAASFYLVDIDEAPSLKKEMGIVEIPTILFYMNGEVIDFVTGLSSRNALIAKLENVLNSKRSAN